MTHDNRNRLTVALGAAWRPLWGAWQLPDGARAIGTVRRGKGTGALLWLADDTYAIGIDGVVERLHQMKAAYAIATAPKRFGGATAGGGRKSVDGAGGRRRSVYIDDDTAAILKQLGDGELSLGIRRAAKILKDEI